MAWRMDSAARKGCDGLDPDNIDGYSNANGLGLTESDAIHYVIWLANQAHARGLAIGLKNGGDIVSDVVNCLEWVVVEQCLQYSECDLYTPFLKGGKPVLEIEYPKGDKDDNSTVSGKVFDGTCKPARQRGLRTLIKNLGLDGWVQAC
jgi:hypothetical protein